HYSADIISLQEVETDQFYSFFLPELKQDGYDGIFSPKSRAKTMSESERKYVDGCAIFFRSAKFALVKEHLIEFNQLAMANSEGSDNMLNRVIRKRRWRKKGYFPFLCDSKWAHDNVLISSVSVGVVEFLSSGRVSSEHRDFKELGYAGSLRRMPGSEHEFTHNFKLASAYSEDIMPYTNYTFDF
ncbi:PREDICTED: CCR4-NOT transcription complex subunit 6, partial [Papilio polytes]|uniref:CCR4-NOT transcription complex subunit 6 n=1 Tax=Papilio polytes TaxID=76194 RepID=UPI000676AC30